MKTLRELFTGLLTALASVLVVVGALAFSISEGKINVLPTQSPSPTSAAVVLQPTIAPQQTLPQATASPTPVPTTCPVPKNWVTYTIQSGDSLESLAQKHNTSVKDLKKANCLISEKLLPGTLLYLPPVQQDSSAPSSPTPVTFPTLTPAPCGPPPGWIRYIVQKGDTLFKISLMYGISVPQLQAANCLGNSTLIYAGSVIFVPNVPPRITPTRTLTPTSQPPTSVPPTKTKTLAPPPPSATAPPPTTAPPTSTTEAPPAPTEDLTATAAAQETANAQTLTAQATP
ncbi:MAG: LysM peptidoglycan-binding domain-containing protein [Anaerolineales bacterium]